MQEPGGTANRSMGTDIKEMELRTEGIVYTGCAEDMEKVLLETEGIIEAKVDYPNELVHIKYDPGSIDRKKVYIAVRRLVRVKEIISAS